MCRACREFEHGCYEVPLSTVIRLQLASHVGISFDKSRNSQNKKSLRATRADGKILLIRLLTSCIHLQ